MPATSVGRADFARFDYHDEWMPAEQDWPRDLLPWADPYIAVLMLRLEERYDWSGASADHPLADDAPSHWPGSVPHDRDWQDVSWQDEEADAADAPATANNPPCSDAQAPGRHLWRRCNMPPVFGGFPLLDDVTDGLDADPV
jgi:hypothetical protein